MFQQQNYVTSREGLEKIAGVVHDRRLAVDLWEGLTAVEKDFPTENFVRKFELACDRAVKRLHYSDPGLDMAEKRYLFHFAEALVCAFIEGQTVQGILREEANNRRNELAHLARAAA